MFFIAQNHRYQTLFHLKVLWPHRANASCQWMQANPEVVSAWGAIERFDYLTQRYPLMGFYLLVILFLAQVSVLSASLWWLRVNGEVKMLRAHSVNFSSIFTLGMILVDCGSIAGLFPVTDAGCNAEFWFYGVGGVLAIGAPLLKTYRVVAIYTSAAKMKLKAFSDRMLFKILVPLVAAEVLLCCLYTAFHQIDGGVQKKVLKDTFKEHWVCNSHKTTLYIFNANIFYLVALLRKVAR